MAEENVIEVDPNLQIFEADIAESVSQDNISEIDQSEEISSSSEDENSELIEEVDSRTNRVREHNLKLEERCKLLQNKLQALKLKLNEERDLWKLEVEEALKYGNLAAGDIEVPTCYTRTSNSNASINDIYDYEHNLLTYHDHFAKAQAEKRASIRKQIAVNNYQRSLMEVETMCNMELLRVKRNYQYLQPLRAIASDWELKNQNVLNNNNTDGFDKKSEKNLSFSETDKKQQNKLSTTIESIGTQIQNDVNEMFEKLRNQCKSIPQMELKSSSFCKLQCDANVGLENIWSYSQDYVLPEQF